MVLELFGCESSNQTPLAVLRTNELQVTKTIVISVN